MRPFREVWDERRAMRAKKDWRDQSDSDLVELVSKGAAEDKEWAQMGDALRSAAAVEIVRGRNLWFILDRRKRRDAAFMAYCLNHGPKHIREMALANLQAESGIKKYAEQMLSRTGGTSSSNSIADLMSKMGKGGDGKGGSAGGGSF